MAIGGVLGTRDGAADPATRGTGDPVSGPRPGTVMQPAFDQSSGQPATPVVVPSTAAGTFTYSSTGSPVRGTGGTVHRYRIAVEDGAGQDVAAFANTVDAILGDARSWQASGTLRTQRVAKNETAEFTIFLATPVTSESMCADGGLKTGGYTSCRLPGKVIINLARWLTMIPNYNAPVAEYQAYVINHEVGHQFGNGHEACPAPGKVAPVMQQQTFGLNGCVANGWPYVDGKRYKGPAIAGQ